MPLPKLDIQHFSHKLVGLDKKIKYRPFTVKEQKILLHAKEAESPEQAMEAIAQIVGLCTNGGVDAYKTPVFDIEDLFLKIRSKSVSEIAEIAYLVKGTDQRIEVKIDLSKIQVTIPEGHSRKIMITDTIGLMMKYPTLGMAIDKTANQLAADDNVIKTCIDYVFTEDEVFYFKDFSEEEVESWLESFDRDALMSINKFFETMPRIRHEEVVTLPDGKKQTLKFEGLMDFFA